MEGDNIRPTMSAFLCALHCIHMQSGGGAHWSAGPKMPPKKPPPPQWHDDNAYVSERELRQSLDSGIREPRVPIQTLKARVWT